MKRFLWQLTWPQIAWLICLSSCLFHFKHDVQISRWWWLTCCWPFLFLLNILWPNYYGRSNSNRPVPVSSLMIIKLIIKPFNKFGPLFKERRSVPWTEYRSYISVITSPWYHKVNLPVTLLFHPLIALNTLVWRIPMNNYAMEWTSLALLTYRILWPP